MDGKSLILEVLTDSSSERPATRRHLRDVTHLTDSAIRRLIGELRDEGLRIVSTCGKDGYWLAETEQEYKDFRREYISKAATYFKRLSRMDGFTDGQIPMELTNAFERWTNG